MKDLLKKKIKYNIIRFFNVYGNGQKPNFVISKFIKNINENKNLSVYGNGKQVRSFCNVEDATKGLIHVIEEGKINTIYNIGNNKEPTSIYSLAQKILKFSNKKLKIKKISYNKSDRDKDREIFKRIPDLKKIKNDTNYEPKINIDTGIKELLKKSNLNKKDELKSKIGIGTLQWGLKYGIANKKGKLSNQEIKNKTFSKK